MMYEYPGSSSSNEEPPEMVLQPQPMEGLNEIGPPPFLNKTFDMVDDPANAHIVSWSRGGHSFTVWDFIAFSTNLLPRYFKHNNFSSFVRQLNTYGFKKIDPDLWEFANEAFVRGHKHLLRNIKRRKMPSQPPCTEVGRFGIDGEVQGLKRDKQVLLMELATLGQQQLNTRVYLLSVEQNLQGTEKKQQHMMSFLARAVQNPAFINQLVQQKEKRRVLKTSITKKRQRPIDQGRRCFELGESSQSTQGVLKPIKAEHTEFGDYYKLPVSELDELALEMQGFGGVRNEKEEGSEETENFESDDKELDDEFWEELLNDGFEDELGTSRNEVEEEDASVLAHRIGFLTLSPK